MDNAEHELRKRILSEDSFDPSKEEAVKASLVAAFERKRKKLLLHLMMYVLVGIGLIFWGAYVLGVSSHVKVMLAGLALILVGYETTVLVKLWYWTVHTRISTAEDLKKLQLLVAGGSLANGGEGSLDLAEVRGKKPFLDRLSYRGWAWVAFAVSVCAGCIGGVIFLRPLISDVVGGVGKYVYHSECHAVVGRDEEVLMTAKISYDYYGITPIDSLDVVSPGELAGVTWRDGEWNALASERRQEGEGSVYRVHFRNPVFRKDRIVLYAQWTSNDSVKRENGLWVFSGSAPWRKHMGIRQALTYYPTRSSYSTWRTRSTVTLPAEAVVEGMPSGVHMRWSDGTRPQFSFEDAQKVENGEAFHITYRLDEGGGEGESSAE